jgi:hypothetical protein
MDLFLDDVDTVIDRMMGDLNREEMAKIMGLRGRLSHLHDENLVKINHSVMELICATHLIKSGFEVELEYMLNCVSCDIYAVKGYGTLIVEVETGFVPPEHATDPQRYLQARITSKITRYSAFANKFCLGTPTHYVMEIHPALTKPPRFRTPEEVAAIKKLCDLYYRNPPVNVEEIRNARLHSIYTVDVDYVSVREWDVSEYMGKAALWTTRAREGAE